MALENIYKGKRFTLSVKSSKDTKIEFCTVTPSVLVIPILENSKVLAISEKREQFHKRVFGLPGGGTDGEKDPLVTAQKELREETGYKAGSLELYMTSALGYTLKFPWYIYIGRNLKYFPLKSDEEEDIKIIELSINELKSYAQNGPFYPDIGALAALRFCLDVESGKIIV